ncbi:hypothetical protein T440DRAFT_500255 [Plenodomus tracheiphilus IPT5]|uniref:Thioesterase domain-containing protein n=1 Tax=Plenodomus tracheiphilus IPT5 TaxID=1408161 RepID=A0A6A7B171_9PLEO|nr:hypothetical protein T440DRAFT_500255 [Plenodomus tracheiphilus IPT5]
MHMREHSFAALTWATPYLHSPNWTVRRRSRGIIQGVDTDCFYCEMIYANKGPASGTRITSFLGIVYGGALLILMDEAFLSVIVAIDRIKLEFLEIGEQIWEPLLMKGRPPQEVLEGRLVAAGMNAKFLKPVSCIGVAGIEVNVLEDKDYKMTMRGIMKDAECTPLMQIDVLWVKLGGVSKLQAPPQTE